MSCGSELSRQRDKKYSTVIVDQSTMIAICIWSVFGTSGKGTGSASDDLHSLAAMFSIGVSPCRFSVPIGSSPDSRKAFSDDAKRMPQTYLKA